MPTNSNAAPAPDSNPPSSTPNLQIVPPPAPKRPPGQLNKGQLAQVELLEGLIPICREAVAVTPLAVRNINSAFLTEAEGRITAARSTSTSAVNCTVQAKAAGVDCGATKEELMGSLRTFQNAARVKYQHTDPVPLERYLVGERIDQSRALLQQSGQTIITNTNTDRPPSVDTEMIVAATTKLGAYCAAPTPREQERAAARDARAARNALVRQIIADRQRIQTAADSAWPYANPANGGMRLKFRLPPNRPYVA